VTKVATLPKRPRWWRRVVRHRQAGPVAVWLLSIAASCWFGGLNLRTIGGALSVGTALVMILVMWWSMDAYNRMLLKIQRARRSLIDERLMLGEWNRAQAIKMRRYIYGEDRDLR
jgi:hypothetical protein